MSDEENDRLFKVSNFRANVMALLNSNWPRKEETDPDTKKRAAVLAVQLRSWGS